MNWTEAKEFMEQFKKVDKVRNPCIDLREEEGMGIESVTDCDKEKRNGWCDFVDMNWENCDKGKKSPGYTDYIRMSKCPFCNRSFPEK